MSDIFGPDDPSSDYPGGSEYPVFEDETIAETWVGQGVFVDESWYDNVTLYTYADDAFQPITMPLGDWYETTLLDQEDLIDLYGIDNLDIIHMLEDYGYWDSDDWDLWRSMYEE